ncbi:MAG TPA: ImmA/IrrE family metallo-endopeptidase [Acholeplasmataceae bacterium]|jgi:Zn-dependent peptidase ImmA (M78 family)|nr:ImmA/IrrE family metallo-endopeptidase [Acholeplasmataceae bacterium]
MSEKRGRLRLNEELVAEIQRKARSKLGECKKQGDIIGSQIFSILSLYTRVLYYPLGKKGPWGITYIDGTKHTNPDIKPFVAINTSIPVDGQVFAAAHELYHIWYDQRPVTLSSSILYVTNGQNKTPDISELKANRFAAEFLVEEDLLHREMRLYSITPGKITIKNILTLASLFTVPYRTMVKRLYEVDAINGKEQIKYLGLSEIEIEQLQKRFSIPIPESDNRIALDNLVDLAVSTYEKKLIAYEKLEYLLSINKLDPIDVGISAPEAFIPLSDDDLEDILEE